MGRKSRYATDAERRAAKLERDRNRKHARVNIGTSQKTRWITVKKSYKLATDEAVTSFLLDW